MSKVLSMFGMFIGGTIGWWIGTKFGGTMTAFIVSIFGTAVGVYYGRKIAREYLD